MVAEASELCSETRRAAQATSAALHRQILVDDVSDACMHAGAKYWAG